MSNITREDVIAALAGIEDDDVREYERRAVNRMKVFPKISPYKEQGFSVPSEVVGQTGELLRSKVTLFRSGPRKGLPKGGLTLDMHRALGELPKLEAPKKGAKAKVKTTKSTKAKAAKASTSKSRKKSNADQKRRTEVWNKGFNAFPDGSGKQLYCAKKAFRYIIHEGMNDTEGLKKAIEETNAWAASREAANA